jgi:hypothetical protein
MLARYVRVIQLASKKNESGGMRCLSFIQKKRKFCHSDFALFHSPIVGWQFL